MLRKMMSDSEASAAAADAVVKAARGSPFFPVPRLFVGFSSKSLSDSDSLRSPTSPLDLKAFSNLGGSLLRSPRSPRSWDSNKIGLGLVDSLTEEVKSPSESKDILFGSQVRLNGAFSLKSCNSLPKYCEYPAQRSSHHLQFGCAKMAGESENGGLVCKESSKSRSCLYAGMEVSGLSLPCTLFYGNANSNSKTLQSGVLSDSKNFVGSLPVSINATRSYIGSLPASEIEQSEDYTCIISHGPNPKTTHIFGDCILEPQTMQFSDGDKNKEKKEGAETYWLIKSPVDPAPCPDDFLSFCFFCKKKLEGNDIYIYRGEKAFCSCECRDQEIVIEEEGEKPTIGSPASTCSSFHDHIFMAGMVVAT